jgi:hypothetical protein
MINIRQHIAELADKTIDWAGIAPDDDTGDDQFVIRLTDGSTWVVAALQKDGDAVEMSIEPFAEE